MCASAAQIQDKNQHEPSLAEILNSSQLHYQAGRLKQAAEGYEAILSRDPKHCDALYYMGLIAQQLGHYDTAIYLIKAAAAQNPSNVQYLHDLGRIYLHLNLRAEAEDCFRQASLTNPEYANPLSYEETSVPIAQALAADIGKRDNQDSAKEYWLLGNQQFQNAQYLHAEALYRKALELVPDFAECHRNLGQCLIRQNKLQQALECCRRATVLNPQYVAAYSDLGFIYLQLQNFSEAEHAYRRAQELKPAAPEGYYNLGNLFRQQFMFSEAIDCYRTALDLIRENSSGGQIEATRTLQIQATNNLALTLRENGQAEEAIKYYREALTVEPDNADLHYSLATALLITGDFAEGWKEHEWRWRMPSFSTKLRDFHRPLWDGRPLKGERILLHAEQGYGDTLQCIRYVPLVAEHGGEIVLEVPARLFRLLKNIPGASQVIVQGEPLPDFSWHCPLMSLPLAFGATMENIPSSTGYLSIPAENVAKERAKWPAEGLRVGLAWSGNPQHTLDKHRSAHLRQFSPLTAIPGVSFYSLQVGEAAKQIAEVAGTFSLADVCSSYTDFTDTADFVAGLDLVITVDTAVAHLAGMLGIPVWILISRTRSDWRWLQNCTDSPWYSSARIFRQIKPGDWDGLIEQVKVNLEMLAENYSQAEHKLDDAAKHLTRSGCNL